MVFVILGALVLALFALTPMLAVVALGCLIVGLGLGLVATPSIIVAQSSVEWHERGVVTGTNMFARSIGSAIGVAIFGAVANSIFAAHGGDETDVATIVSAASAVFIAVLIAAALTAIAAVAMPRHSIHTESNAATSA
jgi:MFS family permease